MRPDLSIIVAVYNGSTFLDKSLPALIEAADEKTEIILVDDASTDNSVIIGKKFKVKIIQLKTKSGAANARNVGVQNAIGKIILFVDADVVIKPDTIKDLRRIFVENSAFCAVFGSYDNSPESSDFFSQYRNLMHHFFHQTGSREAETFWSGFGAIKRQIFIDVGGFDAEKFEIPAIEDIELGYRLREAGHRILLDPEWQAKHLKKWTFYSILRTDFWQRAVPWTEIMLLKPQIKHELNAKTSQKISAIFSGIFLLLLLAISWKWEFIFAALLSLILVIGINKDFYRFFLQRKGFIFTLGVFPMHLLYFLYSAAAFVFSWINVKLLNRTVVVR